MSRFPLANPYNRSFHEWDTQRNVDEQEERINAFIARLQQAINDDKVRRYEQSMKILEQSK